MHSILSSVERGAKHRPRRTAGARRAQQQRSDTRMMCRLIAGLCDMESHRGCQLSQAGRALRQALSVPTSSGGDIPQTGYRGKPQAGTARVPPTQQRQRMPVCRHHAVGRCTYGSMCRFSHQNGYNNDNEEDEDFHNEYQHDNNGQQHNCNEHYDQQHGQDNDGYHDNSDNHDHDAKEATKEQHIEQEDVNDAQHSSDNDDNEVQHISGKNNDDDEVISVSQQDEHNYTQHSNDDIDDIIDVINALTDDESQQMAMEAFPQHLLHEVLERLEQQQADYDSDHTHGSYQNHDLSDDDEVRKQENTSDEEMALQHLADARTQLHCNLKNLEQAVNEYQNQFGHHVDSDGCSSSHDDTEDVLPRLYYPDTNTYDSSIVSLNSLYRQGPAYDITEYVRLHPSDAQDKPLSKQSNIDDHWQTQLKSVNASVDDQNTDATQTRMQTFAELDSTAARSVPANGTNSRSDGDSDSWNYNGDFNAIISLLSDLPVYRMRAALKSMPPIQGVDPHLLQAIIELKFGTTPLSLDHDEDSRSDQSVPSEYEGDGE